MRDIPNGRARRPFRAANPAPRATGRSADALGRVAPEMTRTWKANASGDWKTESNWEPAGIPGAGDELIVTSGTVTFSNALTAASLAVSGGTVKIGAVGNVNAQVKAGDMALSGGTVELGYGSTWSWVGGVPYMEPNTPGHALFAVSGNLAMSGAAKLALHAGPVTEAHTFATGCASLEVGGALTMDGTSQLLPYGDYMTGGSVKITAGTVSVGETAKIDARGKGFNWLDGTTPPNAPGTGFSYNVGGSHGGHGGENTAESVYDFAWAPVMPGSPNGVYNNGERAGGGVIRIHAHSIRVNGTLDAQAEATSAYGGAAGGSIWLTSNQFNFGPNASLTVKGAGSNYSSRGGGGIIAVGWCLKQANLDELAATGTWSGFRERRVMDEAAFRTLLGNGTMTIDVSFGKTREELPDDPMVERGYGSFTFIDGRNSGLVIFLK